MAYTSLRPKSNGRVYLGRVDLPENAAVEIGDNAGAKLDPDI